MSRLNCTDHQIIRAIEVLRHEGCLRTKTIFTGGDPFLWKGALPLPALHAVLTPIDLIHDAQPMDVIDARIRYLHDMKHVTVGRKRISPTYGSFQIDEHHAEVISLFTGDEVRDDLFRSIFGKAATVDGWYVGVRIDDSTPIVQTWAAMNGQIRTIDDVPCIRPGERWPEAFKDGAVEREKRRRVQEGKRGGGERTDVVKDTEPATSPTPRFGFPDPSVPLSMTKAATFWGGDMNQKKLAALMKDGTVRYHKINRQTFMFCREDVPNLPSN